MCFRWFNVGANVSEHVVQEIELLSSDIYTRINENDCCRV